MTNNNEKIIMHCRGGKIREFLEEVYNEHVKGGKSENVMVVMKNKSQAVYYLDRKWGLYGAMVVQLKDGSYALLFPKVEGKR